jgi:Flp pilus assembly protein CpaB
MRSITILVLIIISLSFVYIGCKQAEEVVEKSEETHKEAKQEFEATIPDKVASEVWALIQTENYKLNWKMWPGKQNIYVNPTALQAIENKDPEFPIGSIIVQERYSDKDNLKSVRVAYRIGGDDETNGWFGANYSPDGKRFNIYNNVQSLKP